MAIPTWATSAELEGALGPNAFREIYDEDLDGVADAGLVALDLQRAHSQVAARIRPAYNGGLPASDEDGFLKMATLEYAQAYASERHREYRKNAPDCMSRGKALCEDLRAGKALPKEDAPSPVPSMGSGPSASRTGASFVRDDEGCG